MNEDNFKVKVTLKVESSGHHDSNFPDKVGILEFDATDVHYEVVLDQFKTFLTMMDYVIDPFDKLALVKDNE
jgi:hypothetical protein